MGILRDDPVVSTPATSAVSLLTSDQQRLAAVSKRVKHRLRQLRDLAEIYQPGPGLPLPENQASALAVLFAIKELKAIALELGIETQS